MNTADAHDIGRILGAFPGVRAVYLFGSAAEAAERPDSDIDLAVVPADASVRLL
jgi:predicted nucleotidyltransferase